MSRNAPLVAANSPVSCTVGCTSLRQSGWRLVHAGKISEPRPATTGGWVQENWASQSRVFSVNSAAIARGSKPDELVNVNSRVSTFNRALASSRPPPNPADKLVTARSGARQNPPHLTVRAFSCSDSKFASWAVHSMRYGCRLVHQPQAGSDWAGRRGTPSVWRPIEWWSPDPTGCRRPAA